MVDQHVGRRDRATLSPDRRRNLRLVAGSAFTTPWSSNGSQANTSNDSSWPGLESAPQPESRLSSRPPCFPTAGLGDTPNNWKSRPNAGVAAHLANVSFRCNPSPNKTAELERLHLTGCVLASRTARMVYAHGENFTSFPRPCVRSPMPIPVVTIVPGTEQPAGEGINRPLRAVLRYPDQSVRAGFVKQMAPASVAAEAFCALLLRGWGLNVPEPAIIADPFSFASVDAGYPNLKQRMGWSDNLSPQVKELLAQRGARLVASFADTPRALAADEAIDNRDRNLGNVLWDGANVAWIDHERALGLVHQDDANKLAVMTIMAGDPQGVQRSAIAISLTLGAQAVADAGEECRAMPEAAAFATAITNRLPGLAQRVLARFPQPADLLSQA